MQFNWQKLGHIIAPQSLGLDWANHSIITPTPIYLTKDIIRVYAGFRDELGISRIGYVDLNAFNPNEILKVSQAPCLDIGGDGHFDDSGIILGDVIRCADGKFHMYYVGFQKVQKAKFLAFSGLAESIDGEKFNRVQDYPILDRDCSANMINAVHSVVREEGGFSVWHAKGDGWAVINGLKYPRYNIWRSTSNDGRNILKNSQLCIDNRGQEYRIGRPSVFKHSAQYIMFYTKGTLSGKDYFPGVALSCDGASWQRHDNLFSLRLGKDGSWDSKHIAYPCVIPTPDESAYYVFYNGNRMGETGFGYAKLCIEV